MGVADRLEVITADANFFTTNKRFDRIMSIEMFEVCCSFTLDTLSEWRDMSTCRLLFPLRWYHTLQGDNSLKSVESFDHMMFVCRFQASR
jgi:hypothetical protein